MSHKYCLLTGIDNFTGKVEKGILVLRGVCTGTTELLVYHSYLLRTVKDKDLTPFFFAISFSFQLSALSSRKARKPSASGQHLRCPASLTIQCV
jgi:hypothetical protein